MHFSIYSFFKVDIYKQIVILKLLSKKLTRGTLSGLRHFLATERPLKIMDNAFYFIFKPLFILEIFRLLS